MLRSDITKETIYVWNCPTCGEHNESGDDPKYEETVYCEGCKETLTLAD